MSATIKERIEKINLPQNAWCALASRDGGSIIWPFETCLFAAGKGGKQEKCQRLLKTLIQLEELVAESPISIDLSDVDSVSRALEGRRFACRLGRSPVRAEFIEPPKTTGVLALENELSVKKSTI
jgi:hypothetical protein